MPQAYNRITEGINIEPLKKALNANPDLFGEYPQRGEDGSPHKEMIDIWARYNDATDFLKTGDLSKFADEHDSIWYPVVKEIPEIKKIAFEVMGLVEGERLGGVLITKLPPGGRIYPHTDSGWHATYYDKYYVPIQNKKGSVLAFKEGTIEPNEGDVWQFDNSYLHWVENNTDEERIAMIICIKQEKYTRGGELCLGA